MKSRFALRLATAAGMLGLWACSKDSTVALGVAGRPDDGHQ